MQTEQHAHQIELSMKKANPFATYIGQPGSTHEYAQANRDSTIMSQTHSLDNSAHIRPDTFVADNSASMTNVSGHLDIEMPDKDTKKKSRKVGRKKNKKRGKQAEAPDLDPTAQDDYETRKKLEQVYNKYRGRESAYRVDSDDEEADASSTPDKKGEFTMLPRDSQIEDGD